MNGGVFVGWGVNRQVDEGERASVCGLGVQIARWMRVNGRVFVVWGCKSPGG